MFEERETRWRMDRAVCRSNFENIKASLLNSNDPPAFRAPFLQLSETQFRPSHKVQGLES